MSNSHIKFDWISSNGLVGDRVKDGGTDRQTDKPFGPSPGPQGVGQFFFCYCKLDLCEQLTHQVG